MKVLVFLLGSFWLFGTVTLAAPSISLQPSARYVNGFVPLMATVTGATPKAVDYLVDGVQVARVFKAPFLFNWDTRKTSEKQHQVVARASLKSRPLMQSLDWAVLPDSNSQWMLDFQSGDSSEFDGTSFSGTNKLAITIKDNQFSQTRLGSALNVTLWFNAEALPRLILDIDDGKLRCVFEKQGLKGLTLIGKAYRGYFELGIQYHLVQTPCRLSLVKQGTAMLVSEPRSVTVDRTAPRIVTITPDPRSNPLKAGGQFVIVFSEPVTRNFGYDYYGAAGCPCDSEWSADGLTLTIDRPENPWSPDDDFPFVLLLTDMTDLAGNKLLQQSITFKYCCT
jgi:Bacterial Ig-like domain